MVRISCWNKGWEQVWEIKGFRLKAVQTIRETSYVKNNPNNKQTNKQTNKQNNNNKNTQNTNNKNKNKKAKHNNVALYGVSILYIKEKTPQKIKNKIIQFRNLDKRC